MMSTLERLCHDTDSQLRDLESRLSQYEQVGEDFVMNLEADIQDVSGKITATLQRLDILVDKEPFSRRQNSKLRVDQIRYDFQHLKSALRQLQTRRAQRLQEENQRRELLATDFSKLPNGGHTAIQIQDSELRHHSLMKNVNKSVDNLLDNGMEILNNLRVQGSSLKNIKSRVLDIGTKLGLSTTVMKMIERRGVQDQYFLYAGIVVSLLIMFALYWYFV
ncbi:putative Golgi SNAP receptor complex member 2 [Hypsibius exemplaris]|uniref:Golgi SNAP receptor complex member 2 n=1 Tax=Hypsibius exemplaris TaxID=2072580 RepID=A0A1W0WM41_HYPEX|nr:putative Golgi SNAP receptor complex member 2 [Hypsibius exemplaris]